MLTELIENCFFYAARFTLNIDLTDFDKKDIHSIFRPVRHRKTNQARAPQLWWFLVVAFVVCT